MKNSLTRLPDVLRVKLTDVIAATIRTVHNALIIRTSVVCCVRPIVRSAGSPQLRHVDWTSVTVPHPGSLLRHVTSTKPDGSMYAVKEIKNLLKFLLRLRFDEVPSFSDAVGSCFLPYSSKIASFVGREILKTHQKHVSSVNSLTLFGIVQRISGTFAEISVVASNTVAGKAVDSVHACTAIFARHSLAVINVC